MFSNWRQCWPRRDSHDRNDEARSAESNTEVRDTDQPRSTPHHDRDDSLSGLTARPGTGLTSRTVVAQPPSRAVARVPPRKDSVFERSWTTGGPTSATADQHPESQGKSHFPHGLASRDARIITGSRIPVHHTAKEESVAASSSHTSSQGERVVVTFRKAKVVTRHHYRPSKITALPFLQY